MSRPSADALYVALVNDPQRMALARRLVYRCPKRCMLLETVAVGDTTLVHQKRYKYSREMNLKLSSESGRASNTLDGQNHWRARTYWIDQSALNYPGDHQARLSVSCDHVLDHPLLADEFRQDWDAGHTEVIIRPDHSRYAVE